MSRTQIRFLWCIPEMTLVSLRGIRYNEYRVYFEFSGGHGFLFYLDYSQVEVAADARHRVRSCGPSPRVPCNEADAVRSACL